VRTVCEMQTLTLFCLFSMTMLVVYLCTQDGVIDRAHARSEVRTVGISAKNDIYRARARSKLPRLLCTVRIRARS